MTINKTTQDLSTLRINRLTQEMYDDALENDQINATELYLTDYDGVDSTELPTSAKIAEFDGSAKMNSTDMTSAEISSFVNGLSYISSPEEYVDEHDSGWITAQVASDFQLYASNSTIRYRKIGYMVDLHGIVTPAATITGSDTNYIIFTLPEHYRPQYARTYVMQGSGNATWELRILANGNVVFCRYRDASLTTATAYSNAANGTWLPFNAIFTVNDNIIYEL